MRLCLGLRLFWLWPRVKAHSYAIGPKHLFHQFLFKAVIVAKPHGTLGQCHLLFVDRLAAGLVKFFSDANCKGGVQHITRRFLVWQQVL